MTKCTKRIGRPTKAPQSHERVQLGLRVRADVKRRLDEAAERNGRSQSQEAEIRLERTLFEEDGFGGPEMLNMARLMGAAFLRGGQAGARGRGHPKWSPARWLEDPWCYSAAIGAVADALKAAQPVRLKFKEGASPEQRRVAQKVFDTLAQMSTRGADIKITLEGEENE